MKKIAFAFAAVAAIGFSGCVIPQSPECAQYVDCVAHYDEVFSTGPTDTSTFEADGTCWQNQQTADSCTESCSSANTSLHDGLESAGEDTGPCE